MDNNLNNLQRVEAGRRLEILGYEKDVCEKYLDEEFAISYKRQTVMKYRKKLILRHF